MKHFHHYSFATKPAKKLAMLIATSLLTGTGTTYAATPTDITHAELAPILTLYRSVENSAEITCPFELPTMGSVQTIKLQPKEACPRKEDEDKDEDKPFKPHSIRIHNMPIKSKVLLVDSKDCTKEGHAWVELDTSRANASLEKMGIDKIWSYAGSPEKPGYVYNKGEDNQTPSFGFRVIGKGAAIQQGELACIVVTLPKRGI